MNDIKKIGLTALAGSLVAGSVSAAELTATGSASLTYSGGDEKETTGQGWTMGDSITMSASGDVNDIGVTLSFEIDNDDVGGGNVYDTHSITFDLGDAGTLAFFGHGGSSAVGAKDDVMPTAYQEPWDVVTGAETTLIGGGGGDNMFSYTYSHDSGLTANITYVNAADAVTDVSNTEYGIEYTGVDGLTIGYAQGDVEKTTNTKSTNDTMYAKYAIGGITAGIQFSEKDNDSGVDYESTGMGISYQVNDDLAVSYGAHTIETSTTTPDQDSSAVSFSYTMGSLSISGSLHNVDSVNHSTTNDREHYELSVGFNF